MLPGRHDLHRQGLNEVGDGGAIVGSGMDRHAALLSDGAGELSQNDEYCGANRGMQGNGNAVFARLRESSRLQLIDEKGREVHIGGVTHSRLRELGEIFRFREVVEGAVREHLDNDVGEARGGILIDPVLRFEDPEQSAFFKGCCEDRTGGDVASIHVVGEQGRDVVEEQQQGFDPSTFPQRPEWCRVI